MKPVLRINELLVDFRLSAETVHAVRGVSLDVHETETVAIVGESGSGKTATALAVPRLNPEPPCVYAGGDITLDGAKVLSMSENELRSVRGKDVSMIFQDPMTSLNPTRKIGVQVAEVLRKHVGKSRRQAHSAAVESLAEAGIPDAASRAEQYPHQLSGGLRQRAVIAMALVRRPKLLIADEPTTALDVTVQAQILDVLVELQQRHGIAILLITHDLGVVAEVADRVVVMRDGEAVEAGEVHSVLSSPVEDYTRRLLAATPRIEEGNTEAVRP